MGDRRMRTAVVLDPHPLWLDAVQRVLESTDIMVVGASTSVEEAAALVDAHDPDLFALEVLSGGSTAGAVAALRHARERRPELRVIVFSASDDPQVVQDALAAGAFAYVLKTAPPEDVAFAVRHAFSPSMYLAESHAKAPQSQADGDGVAQLTKREREILRLVAEGASNGDVARKLWVTEQTVKFHLSNVYRKLGVANRTEASRWAQVHRLLSDPHTIENLSSPSF